MDKIEQLARHALAYDALLVRSTAQDLLWETESFKKLQRPEIADPS